MAFMDATLKRGIDMVLDLVGFDAAVARADLVITGEGHIDGQSGQGKLIQGVCARAGGVPVIALCGKLSASPEQIKAIGLTGRLFHKHGGSPAGRDAGGNGGQPGKGGSTAGGLAARALRPEAIRRAVRHVPRGTASKAMVVRACP